MIKERKAKSVTKPCFIIPVALTDWFSADGNDAFEKLAFVAGVALGGGRFVLCLGKVPYEPSKTEGRQGKGQVGGKGFIAYDSVCRSALSVLFHLTSLTSPAPFIPAAGARVRFPSPTTPSRRKPMGESLVTGGHQTN